MKSLWDFQSGYPVRPPQTAIGRCLRTATNGTLPGSAPVPVAVFGVVPLPLKIAQPFMAGTRHPQFSQVPSRDERCLRTATIFSAVPDGTFFILLTLNPAMNGWAIFIPAPWRLCDFAFNSVSRPKRQRTGALQDASRNSFAIGQRASVLECGGPPPLFYRARYSHINSYPHCPARPIQTACGNSALKKKNGAADAVPFVI